MTIELRDEWSDGPPETAGQRASAPADQNLRLPQTVVSRMARALRQLLFSSITRRIVILNLMGLVALLTGILYMNQFREGLIDARIQSLLTQGEIISAAIAASATVETGAITVDPEALLDLQTGESFLLPNDPDVLQFPIDPVRVAPLLRRLVSPTQTRARIYDNDGALLIDSRHLYSRGQILRYSLPPLEAAPPSATEQMWERLQTWLWRGELPAYQELGPTEGLSYPEVATSLKGSSASVVRVTDRGTLIVSVAVPVQRFRAVLGTLLLSTEGGDIEAILRAERLAIVRVFAVAGGIMVILSILLASTVAGPMRRLADGADRVRRSVKDRAQIPDYSGRSDEIGHLSSALRDMTNALYARMEAIESFAADVAHELKNPLTSLRSAVETLPLARNEEGRERLIGIIQHDVRRLDRLISDISNASRLDAELVRDDLAPVDLAQMLQTVTTLANETRGETEAEVLLEGADTAGRTGTPIIAGHQSRLGQVIGNLIDNARSFSPDGGVVRVSLEAGAHDVTIAVEDDGPGIDPHNVERIFERFYTDRPGVTEFGQNSGLGLSISQQIVEAHGGTIRVSNRPLDQESAPRANPFDPDQAAFGAGARFIVTLPRTGKPRP